MGQHVVERTGLMRSLKADTDLIRLSGKHMLSRHDDESGCILLVVLNAFLQYIKTVDLRRKTACNGSFVPHTVLPDFLCRHRGIF